MPGSWIIVEDTQQADAAIRLLGQDTRRRCITTTAEAYYGLKSLSVPAVSLHSYLTLKQLNKIAEKCEAQASKLCGSLDAEISTNYPNIGQNFKPFDALMYQLQRVLGVFSLRFEELNRFCLKERPEQMLFWESPQAKIDIEDGNLAGANRQAFTLRPDEKVTSVLLQHSHWREQFDINLIPLESDLKSVSTTHVNAFRFRSFVKGVLNMNRWRGLGTVGFKSVKTNWRDSARLLLLDAGADVLDFVIQATADKEVNIDWWTNWQLNPVSLRTGLGVKLSKFTSNGVFENWNRSNVCKMIDDSWGLVNNDISEPVSAALKLRLAHFALDRIPLLASLYQRAVQYFIKRQPLAACCGGTTGDALQIIALAASQAGVPVVSFQHGGNVGYVVLHWLLTSDLKVPDIVCTYGKGVSKTLEKQKKDYGLSTKIVTIGCHWGKQHHTLKFGKRSDSASQAVSPHVGTNKSMLLYAATGLLGNARHGPHYWYDDTAYFIHQKELVSLLMTQSEFEVIVKLHYKDRVHNPLKDYVREQGRDNVRVEQKQRLSATLPSADLVLIDWPSTTLLEALALNKQVIYLDLGLLKWIPEARSLLKRNLYWVDKGGGWQDLVLGAIKNYKDGKENHLDKAFFKAYANSDYKPAKVWDALGQIGRRAGSA